MDLRIVVKRIEQRLEELGLDAATVSRAASPTGSPDLIRNWQRRVKRDAAPGATYRTVEPVARELGVSVEWLAGEEDESPRPMPGVLEVPRVTWVTAGELSDLDAFDPLSLDEYPTVLAADLPAGRYIALRVQTDAASMNKISPPESVIFVNLDDRRLVANACYVIADEQGRATYKRYRPGQKPPFQPASYEKIKPPKLEGAIRVVGRVRRSMIDM